MADKIETINGSIVQHGHHNARMYVMHLDTTHTHHLIGTLDKMAVESGYEKICAKIPATSWEAFRSAGYTREAVVPGFYKGKTDGLFVAKYMLACRRQADRSVGPFRPTHVSATKAWVDPDGTPIVACTPDDAGTLALLYKRVFETYAFPIHRPEFIRWMMRKNGFYFCARINHEIAAVAATEIDFENENCEMTDFATLPRYRGRGLASKLLHRLDEEAYSRGVKTAYTIARADSQAMNRIFAKAGYRYAGQLIKNTQIGGRIRSMTVWYKDLVI